MKKLVWLILLLAFLLLGCTVRVVCPDHSYVVCEDCTLEKEWVVGDVRYFETLENGFLYEYSCSAKCYVTEE